MKPIIAPSILSADFGCLEKEIKDVVSAGADWIHVDVMDGVFVPNITIGPLVVQAARRATDVPLDVHMMVDAPDNHINAFAKAGADIITVHAEACIHLHRTLQSIKSLGKMAGVTFNPATPINCLPSIIDLVDLVMIMSVNPGFGGQSFIASVLPKIQQAKTIIDEIKESTGRTIHLEVDGGVSASNAAVIKAAGANVLVAGNAIYNTPNYQDAIQNIKTA